ncbi:sensor histidine kinase [Pseudonocardia charpentierae]|uniref:histidine kinase n=1 Tax=Pseudonocardia charpentierae TaxID=3075545 RepID=A0ABU2NEF9_9PSEU|nr:histidine kinase [Pseudonocardia sp. DSM 45834]MDT0352342.1 histidine kinase [Pseudonocardia sp. DSM 45834]
MTNIRRNPGFRAARSSPGAWSGHALQLALALVLTLGTVLAVVGAGAVAAASPAGLGDAAPSAVGLVYLAVGAVAWSRRPGNRLGLLICVTGTLFLLASLYNAAEPVMVFLGVLGGQSVLAGVLHLLLAFPSGRLTGARDRALVVAGYLTTTVPLFLQYAYSGEPVVLPIFDQGADAGVVAAADLAHRVLATAVLLISAAVLVQRLRRSAAVGAQRRTRAVVYLTGMLVLTFIPFSALVLEPVAALSSQARFLLQIGALAVVPFVFAVAILRGGFARTAQLEELGLWLGSADGRRPVREALAAALGDESLELYFPSRPHGWLLDEGGRVVAPERDGATVSVDAADGAVAVIAYDSSLIGDPSLVQQAGRVVALALERERLTAELLARRQELLESRSRLVQVADDERRRFAQDLHDLLQSRLVLATLRAGTLGSAPGLDPAIRHDADALRDDLTEAVRELRRLVHGVMPALLLERGLFAAAEDLLDRSPIPVDAHWCGVLTELPAAVSTGAYFILAEATANAVKHSRASAIRVRVERADDALTLDFADDGVGGATPTGAGLRGVRDRVDVLDGRFELLSPPHQGTRLLVQLPCG